ncbi:hypothetical protein [Neorhizobium sp. NCHU2750]|uniref:hypothetical protein n=1 Tax=Neorhizobium sp. NCHU2750 TaxID=1825976 RepID=UPI000E7535FB|nr:hypothetical protein NCHU2750_49030 [Neorhizobium sp. NCHU2750]
MQAVAAFDDRFIEDSKTENALASVALALATGGDRRIFADPVSGRNRYGTRVTPAEAEVSFASTTASNISSAGFRAAGEALARLIAPGHPGIAGLGQWFQDIRHRMAGGLGLSQTDIVLAASGTDIELIAIALVTALSARPITNIVIAPDETGSGVPRAATGCHYSDLTALGDDVLAGAAIENMPVSRIETRSVPIRDAMSRARTAQEIDGEVIDIVERELKRGRDVLVHLLDTSKTGLSGLTRDAARHVARLAPGRVWVIVDACQFRCSFATIRQDLADGFMVAITGSKFLAGPPFAGALLLPAALGFELTATGDLPSGLQAYSAAQDWPARVRTAMKFPFRQEANIGLGLRWVAALEHLDGLSAIEDVRRKAVKEAILGRMRARVDASTSIFLHPEDDGDHLARSAILPFSIRNHPGGLANFEKAQAIHAALRDADCGPVCHIGQAVRLGERAVLRLSVSAPDVIGVAGRLAAGGDLAQALQPLEARLDVLFDKLDRVLSS